MKTLLFSLLATLSLTGCAATQPPEFHGIRHLIEVNDGRRAVQGVQIVLHAGRFIPELTAEQIDIKELSHGRAITEQMRWAVHDQGRRLDIRFKPEKRGFARGSTVVVNIDRSAIVDAEPDLIARWYLKTDPGDDLPGWGPGVTDPDALHRKIEQLLVYRDAATGTYLSDRNTAIAAGMLSVLTWEQAAGIYRKATYNLKRLMCDALIGGQHERFKGMTRPEIIALLGEPDDRDPSDGPAGPNEALGYSGHGTISDSTGALIIIFGDDGKFLRIGYPG